MAQFEYACTDPSHPPRIPGNASSSMYRLVRDEIAKCEPGRLSVDAVARSVLNNLHPRLRTRSSHEWQNVQASQSHVGSTWQDVLCELDNVGWLVGWFINDCATEGGASELHSAQCHLAFEANRTLFAVTNQLRAALAQETFGYLRALHETWTRSRFLVAHAADDPDLPARLIYYTNTLYLDFYQRFSEMYQEDNVRQMWVELQEDLERRFGKPGKGDYWWAYPLLKKKNGQPDPNPTFRKLMDHLKDRSAFARLYYDVATSKAHGTMIWNPLMVLPDARSFRFHSFHPGYIGLVLDLMLPMYEDVITHTATSCIVSKHAVVMSIVRAIIAEVQNSIATVKDADSDLHLGVRPTS